MNSLNIVKRRLRSPFLNKIRYLSEVVKQQNDVFNSEQSLQKDAVGRVEKIEINYEGPPGNEVLIMNKNISTPYDCAKHLGDTACTKSVVALLNGETLWHMHKPIPDACKLELLHYHSQSRALVNKTFWRSCSFLLGAIASQAFRDNIKTFLHSFPSPNVKSGSFVYDIQLELEDWQPTLQELKVLSIEMIKFCQQDYTIECLDVSKDLAFKIFKDNPHKTEQIPDIAENNGGKVTLFRVGSHIDISKGPMIPNTNHLGRITVANVIKLQSDIPGGPIYRFQGVALPKALVLNHFAFGLLEDRAKLLNPAKIPRFQNADNEDNSFVAKMTA